MSRPLILLNDLHGDTRSPAGRKDDWFAALTDKLAQVGQAARKIHAAAVCVAGDWFHPKTRTLGVWPVGTHEVVSLFLRWAHELRSADVQVLAIPGNHDLAFDRLDSVPRQPLGALFDSGLVRDVSYEAVRCDAWTISGVPYPDAKDLAAFTRVAPAHPGTVGVLMAHCFAERAARDFFGEPVHAYADIRVPGYAVYHFGHDHSDHGVAEIEGRYYVQVGALLRGSLSGEEVHRRPQIVVLQQADGVVHVRPVALRVRPADEVFNFEAKARREAEESVIAAFVEHLDALTLPGSDELPAQVRALDLPPDIHARVETYLDRAHKEAV